MHNNAAGCGIKINNIDKLISYSNEKLANINFNEGFYEVDFIVNGNFSKLPQLIAELDKGKKFFGQGCKEPLIAIENIALPPSSYSIIGKAADTLRFEFNGITYIKFKATELIEELKQKSGSLNITIIGRGNINTWGGYNKPQILIDNIEIQETSIYDF